MGEGVVWVGLSLKPLDSLKEYPPITIRGNEPLVWGK